MCEKTLATHLLLLSPGSEGERKGSHVARTKNKNQPSGLLLFFHIGHINGHLCLCYRYFVQSNKETTWRMTAIENKEEISDTDSGIILHCGENSVVIALY